MTSADTPHQRYLFVEDCISKRSAQHLTRFQDRINCNQPGGQDRIKCNLDCIRPCQACIASGQDSISCNWVGRHCVRLVTDPRVCATAVAHRARRHNFVAPLILPDQDAAHPPRAARTRRAFHRYAAVSSKRSGAAVSAWTARAAACLLTGGQELVKPRQIGQRLAGPFQLHHCGKGPGMSVPRLAAQACTAWWSMTCPASTSANAPQRETPTLFVFTSLCGGEPTRGVSDRALSKARDHLHMPAVRWLNDWVLERAQRPGFVPRWRGLRVVAADASVRMPALRPCHRVRCAAGIACIWKPSAAWASRPCWWT